MKACTLWKQNKHRKTQIGEYVGLRDAKKAARQMMKEMDKTIIVTINKQVKAVFKKL